jgi:hypothetical protein
MTVISGTGPSGSLYPHIRARAGSRTPSGARLRLLSFAGIAAIGIAGLVAATQFGSGVVAPAAGPVRGEFRLAPGNQEPPGIVIPLESRAAVRGEFRLGPGNAMPPGVMVPLAPPARGAGPVRGEFRLAPGNQEPMGVVIPTVTQDGVPGEFRLGPGNALPPGVVVPR